MKIYSKLHRSIVTYYETIKEQYGIKYLKEAFIAIVLSVCFVGGYFLHKFYVQSREEQAFVALSEVYDSFNHAQRAMQSLDEFKDKEKIAQIWSDTQILLEALYKDNISSNLAPYFQTFKAQIILDRDHNLDEAIKVMDDALENISRNTAMGSLYHMKRIKMGFGSSQAGVKENALSSLIEIAKNPSEYAYQEALYLLGVYYISIGDQTQAFEAFKVLVDTADDKALLKSPWVALAQEKLGIETSSTDVQ